MESATSALCNCLYSLPYLSYPLSSFFRTEGVLSYLNSSTHRFPRFPLRNLRFPDHACCVSFIFRCNGHSLRLSFYLTRSRRIKNPPCSAYGHPMHDISHLILPCPATDALRRFLFGGYLFLRPAVQALGSCPASGIPWCSAMLPSLGKIR